MVGIAEVDGEGATGRKSEGEGGGGEKENADGGSGSCCVCSPPSLVTLGFPPERCVEILGTDLSLVAFLGKRAAAAATTAGSGDSSNEPNPP